MDSIEITDQQAAAVATKPRVSLESMKAKVRVHFTFTADKAVGEDVAALAPELSILTICIVVMENGYTVIGKSAPASPENFNAELGAKFAYEDAIRQLWPLEGYALREKLSAQ